ncbi:hypothetical protein [Kitasatospora sp. NPDC090308]|uniref:hypothetical protein n=1 Tax=Kitasatospora sp. NPDC090308 TaxID=3364082 RepID=UPI0038059FFD
MTHGHKGRPARQPAGTAAFLQGVTLLLALLAAVSPPCGWIGVTALVAAELIALAVVLSPLRPRGRAAAS